MTTELTGKERNVLFWGSFIALMTCGVGFGIRVMSIGTWIDEFNIDGEAAGGIFGASLWPIAVGMILFSLIVDKVGYKTSMIFAFIFHLISTVWTFLAKDMSGVVNSFILAGFAHGIVEASINPLCATMYKTQKSKMLNILHASWPAGIVVGASICMLFGGDEGLPWRTMFLSLLIPTVLYGVAFILTKHYPQDERVENKVTYLEMLREFGGLSIFLATTFLFYELGGVFGLFGADALLGTSKLTISLIVGAVAGIISGFILKSPGKPLFFILCLIMIPLATAEIATDGWIRELMKPVLANEYNIDSGWAIVLSSFIMMVLRFFAGVPLKYLSPPAVLLVSSIFSIVGLFLLSGAAGFMIFIAFVLYGIGQTFYWPTVLGFTSEQFPKGGAMTLNTVSAMGLLTVGIFGIPFLGAVGDNFNSQMAKQEQPALYETTAKHEDGKEVPKYAIKDKSFFGWSYESVKVAGITNDPSLLTEKGKELASMMEVPENATEEQIAAAKKAAEVFKKADPKEIRTEEGIELISKIQNNGRKVLQVAAALPAIMAVAFLLIILYFKTKGGYKPVSLDHKDPEEVAQF